jgi:hypothetical protein
MYCIVFQFILFFSKAGSVLLYKYVPAIRSKSSARSSPVGFPLLSGLGGLGRGVLTKFLNGNVQGTS